MKNSIFYGSGVALVTPMNDDFSVNYKKLKELVHFHIDNKTDAIIACGTTGESSTLTDEEHIKVIKEVILEANGKIPVIAGTGSNNTEHAIYLSQEAQSLKADGVLVVTPYYNKTSQEGLKQHYEAIANSIDIPLIIYDIPSRTGCKIEIATFKELSKHKNIIGVKAACGSISNIAKIASNCGEDFSILSGNDDQIVPIMSLGGVGVISVIANILPEQTHNICRLFLDGETQKSLNLQLKFLDLINNLFIDVNPIPVKEAMNLMGFNVGPVRLPLFKLNETKLNCLKNCLIKYNLI